LEYLIAIDTFTGIWKAKKLKEKITSRKLSGIISKLALYEITVIMFFLIDRFYFK
jgi:phage-related holin